jgi:hypothetical protein
LHSGKQKCLEGRFLIESGSTTQCFDISMLHQFLGDSRVITAARQTPPIVLLMQLCERLSQYLLIIVKRIMLCLTTSRIFGDVEDGCT